MIRQIQKASPGTVAAPLILFHDASGTIASYYNLGSLQRDVYAVAATDADENANETLTKMASRYYAEIKARVHGDRIVLGGWSLGGMIALQVAWIFARDPTVTVQGVIMVDSPFPKYDHVLVEDTHSETTCTREESRLKTALLRSVKMLQSWQPPSWRRLRQPHTAMLCASAPVDAAAHPSLAFVDQFRNTASLGWAEHASHTNIDKIYPVVGHHFSIFGDERIEGTSETLAAVTIDVELSANADDDEDY